MSQKVKGNNKKRNSEYKHHDRKPKDFRGKGEDLKREEVEVDENIYYGFHNVRTTLQEVDVTKLYVQKGITKDDIIGLARAKGVPVTFVDKYKLDKMTNNAAHQGLVCEAAPVEYKQVSDIVRRGSEKKNPLVLIFDEVTDVNNLGAILRISDAFGVSGVVIGKKRSAQLNASVAKSSTGAINFVDVARVTNIRHAINELKENGYFVAYLDMDGDQKVQDVKFDIPVAIVVGGEDKGITPSIKKYCDFGITIDMYGSVNSLNVSSATSILAHNYAIKQQ